MNDSRKLFVKCVLVLAGIALISGLLLGLFSQVTAISPEEEAARAAAKIAEIRSGDYRVVETDVEKSYPSGEIGYVFVDETGQQPVYAVVVTGHRGYGGDISFYVVVEGDAVVDLRVGGNKETPGVSDNALKNQRFLDGFKRPLAELDVLLNEGDGIDAATGATYSSRGTKNAFAALALFWKDFVKEVRA